jgi:hypothetical protein
MFHFKSRAHGLKSRYAIASHHGIAIPINQGKAKFLGFAVKAIMQRSVRMVLCDYN